MVRVYGKAISIRGIMSVFDKIYSKSPLLFQNIGVSIYGIYWYWFRFGGKFKIFENGYKDRERFTNYEWAGYQKKKLQKLLTIAFEKVPYYRSILTSVQIQSAVNGNITLLPLLEKETIRKLKIL